MHPFTYSICYIGTIPVHLPWCPCRPSPYGTPLVPTMRSRLPHPSIPPACHPPVASRLLPTVIPRLHALIVSHTTAPASTKSPAPPPQIWHALGCHSNLILCLQVSLGVHQHLHISSIFLCRCDVQRCTLALPGGAVIISALHHAQQNSWTRVSHAHATIVHELGLSSIH